MTDQARKLANAVRGHDSFFMSCIENLEKEITYPKAFGSLVLHSTLHDIGIEIFDPTGNSIFDSNDHIATRKQQMKGKLLHIEIVKSITERDHFHNYKGSSYLTRHLKNGYFIRGNNAPFKRYVYLTTDDKRVPMQALSLSAMSEMPSSTINEANDVSASGLTRVYIDNVQETKGDSGGIDISFDICDDNNPRTLQIGGLCQPSTAEMPDILRPCNNDFYRLYSDLEPSTAKDTLALIENGNHIISDCNITVNADNVAYYNTICVVIGICVFVLDDDLKRDISKFIRGRVRSFSR